MSAWILVVSTAWQVYTTGVWAPATTISMQEFNSQLACARAADAVRAQLNEQTSGFYGKSNGSVHAICISKDVK